MSDNSCSVDKLDNLDQWEKESNHLAELSLKLKRVGDHLSEQSLKNESRVKGKSRKSTLDFKRSRSPFRSDFSSYSEEEEEDAADDDDRASKLDESGLPTNQEFTVGGGKTVQVPTIRLIS